MNDLVKTLIEKGIIYENQGRYFIGLKGDTDVTDLVATDKDTSND